VIAHFGNKSASLTHPRVSWAVLLRDALLDQPPDGGQEY